MGNYYSNSDSLVLDFLPYGKFDDSKETSSGKIKKNITGWKKIMCSRNGNIPIGVVCKLKIPRGALVVKPPCYASDPFYRTNRFTIKEIKFPDGIKYSANYDKCYSWYKQSYKYEEGKTYREYIINTRQDEIGKGLYFFTNEKYAKDCFS